MKRALGADPNRLATIKRTIQSSTALWDGNFISDGNAEDKLLWALRAALRNARRIRRREWCRRIQTRRRPLQIAQRLPPTPCRSALTSPGRASAACPTTLERDAEELAATNGPRKTAIAFRIRKNASSATRARSTTPQSDVIITETNHPTLSAPAPSQFHSLQATPPAHPPPPRSSSPSSSLSSISPAPFRSIHTVVSRISTLADNARIFATSPPTLASSRVVRFPPPPLPLSSSARPTRLRSSSSSLAHSRVARARADPRSPRRLASAAKSPTTSSFILARRRAVIAAAPADARARRRSRRRIASAVASPSSTSASEPEVARTVAISSPSSDDVDDDDAENDPENADDDARDARMPPSSSLPCAPRPPRASEDEGATETTRSRARRLTQALDHARASASAEYSPGAGLGLTPEEQSEAAYADLLDTSLRARGRGRGEGGLAWRAAGVRGGRIDG